MHGNYFSSADLAFLASWRFHLLFLVVRQRAGRNNLHQQLADVELVLGKRLFQLGEPIFAVGPDRLLHRVVEQLLDERRVRFLAVGQERGQLADAVELRNLAARE